MQKSMIILIVLVISFSSSFSSLERIKISDVLAGVPLGAVTAVAVRIVILKKNPRDVSSI